MQWRRHDGDISCAGRSPITLEVFQGYGQVGTCSLLALSGIRGRAVAADICSAPSPSTSQGRWSEFKAGAMTMTHSRRTSFDCQLVDAYLVSLQSDIEAKWRDIRCIRDDIHLLMRSRAGSSAADSEAIRTISERLDRMLSTNRIVRETLLELRKAALTLTQDLDDEGT